MPKKSKRAHPVNIATLASESDDRQEVQRAGVVPSGLLKLSSRFHVLRPPLEQLRIVALTGTTKTLSLGIITQHKVMSVGDHEVIMVGDHEVIMSLGKV